jgi:chromosome segregation ATPase
MEKKLILQDVIDSINRIAAVLTERINAVETKSDLGFSSLEKRAGSLEHRFGRMEADIKTLNAKVDNNAHEIHSIREKTSRTESMVYIIQKDNENFREEMRGIHKVIDRFDGRVTRLEAYAGFPIESEED